MIEKWEEMSIFADQDSLCGKMSSVHSQAENRREKTLGSYLRKSQESKIPQLQFLDLRSGQEQATSWEMIGALDGEQQMLNIGELPNEENASQLSQVLEINPLPKYYMSLKACEGMLAKAGRKGKRLPQVLEKALSQQVTLLKLGGGVERDSKGKRAGKGALVQTEISATLGASQDQTLITAWGFDQGASRDIGDAFYQECSKTLANGTCAGHHNAVVVYSPTVVCQSYVARRLTPKENERLQGFPDDWTNIGEWIDSKGKTRQTTDTARYKALGNSIAVGFANKQSGYWMWLLKRISAQFERSATMGSLFDGISGFPLAWATYNGARNCLWSSEIEEFCVAVCKKHFGDEATGEKGDIMKYLEEYMQ